MLPALILLTACRHEGDRSNVESVACTFISSGLKKTCLKVSAALSTPIHGVCYFNNNAKADDKSEITGLLKEAALLDDFSQSNCRMTFIDSGRLYVKNDSTQPVRMLVMNSVRTSDSVGASSLELRQYGVDPKKWR